MQAWIADDQPEAALLGRGCPTIPHGNNVWHSEWRGEPLLLTSLEHLVVFLACLALERSGHSDIMIAWHASANTRS